MGEYEALIKKYQDMKQNPQDTDEILSILDEISKMSYEEPLLFEWALWYWKADYPARAKRVLKQMISFFKEGDWVDRAKEAVARIDNDEDYPADLECYLKSGAMLPVTGEDNGEGIGIVGDSPEGPIPEKKAEKQKKDREDEGEDSDVPAIIREAFAGMVGMESVKKELVSFYNIAKLEKLREEQLGLSGNDSRSYNFILYGNPGTGKTTVARVIGKVLYALNIRQNDKFMEVDRSQLVSQYVGETAKNVKECLNEIKGGTLFIDEAYSLYKKGDEKDFGQEAIDTLLKDMEDHRSEYSVIMAGYRNEMTEMLNHSNPGFRSRFTYKIVIPDYTDDELLEIATKVAQSHHYKIEEKGYEALRKKINRERIDETFGNARFIREVINEAEKNLANRLEKAGSFDKEALILLKAEDILPEEDPGKGLDELLKELDELIGLEGVKHSVQELLDKIMVQKELEKRGISRKSDIGSMHMAFKGNAGTGKTTVARLLGKIFTEMGVLKRADVFVEVKRADLIGQYQGHTAAKVKDVIRSAMGGVLFIDEAYALVNGDGDSFGKEAVDTLVAEMENHRDSLIVILAGYTGDIDRFLEANQGLRSRVTRDLFFEDYTLDEMVEMFRLQVASARMILPEELSGAVRDRLKREIEATDDFGNGRGVRNVFEAVVRSLDSRIAGLMRSGADVSDDDMITLTQEDIV